MRRALPLLLSLVAATHPVAAQEGDSASPFFSGFSLTSRKQPIEVSSERLDFDYKNRKTVFRGNVEVIQGDVHLRSQQLTVIYMEVENQQKLREVTAEGNVTITQGERKAIGDRARFDEKTRTLILTGNARLEENSNQVNGDTIVVYPDESRMEVKGENSRVKLILFPGQEGEAPSAPASPSPTTPTSDANGPNQGP